MFLLNANAFIEASRLYYGFDIAPGFWRWLEDPLLAGQVASMQVIRDEVTAGSGPLVVWAKSLPSDFWLQETADTVSALTGLSAWAMDPNRPYSQAAVNEFLGSADLRLVAHAAAIGATVVTSDAARVTWTDPFTAYRSLGLQLR